jgi:hypothetical protein
VNDVDRAQVHPNRPADRNDHFIRRDEPADIGDLLTGILELEPPLVTGRRDLDRIRFFRLRHIVGRPDRFQRRDRDYDQRQDRSADQAELDQGVAVALGGRLGVLVGLAARAEFQRGVGQCRADENENHQRHPHRHHEHVKLFTGHGTLGHHRRLVAVHAPEVEIAPGEQGKAGEQGGEAAPAGEGRDHFKHVGGRKR